MTLGLGKSSLAIPPSPILFQEIRPVKRMLVTALSVTFLAAAVIIAPAEIGGAMTFELVRIGVYKMLKLPPPKP